MGYDVVQCHTRSWLAVLLTFWLVLGCGCSCEKTKAPQVDSKNKPTAPLTDLGVPASISAEIHPAVGTTTPRPVHLVMSRTPSACEQVLELRLGRAHILCLSDSFEGSPDQVEQEMKGALRYLKDKYDNYVAGSPAHLSTDEHLSPLGLQLMLREPNVFSHGYLPGLPTQEMTSTMLYALFNGGVKTLLFSEELPSSKAALRSMAKRGGLLLEGVGQGPDALRRALDVMARQDKRLSAPPAVAP